MTSTTDSPSPSFPITLLAPVAEALESSDPQVRAEAFARMGEEALALCEQASSEQMREFWLELSEDFQWETQAVLGATR
jgi:DNA-binding transcriptional regulator YbjK